MNVSEFINTAKRALEPLLSEQEEVVLSYLEEKNPRLHRDQILDLCVKHFMTWQEEENSEENGENVVTPKKDETANSTPTESRAEESDSKKSKK